MTTQPIMELYRSLWHYYAKLKDQEWFSTNKNCTSYSIWTLGVAQWQQVDYNNLPAEIKAKIMRAYQIHQAGDQKQDFLSLSRIETWVKEPLSQRSWVDEDNDA